MAVYIACTPGWASCGNCKCVDGRESYPKWDTGDDLLFQEGDSWVSTSYECPRRRLKEGWDSWMFLYHFYKNGHLQVTGGVADQEMRYLTAMKLIEDTVRMLEQNK